MIFNEFHQFNHFLSIIGKLLTITGRLRYKTYESAILWSKLSKCRGTLKVKEWPWSVNSSLDIVCSTLLKIFLSFSYFSVFVYFMIFIFLVFYFLVFLISIMYKCHLKLRGAKWDVYSIQFIYSKKNDIIHLTIA